MYVCAEVEGWRCTQRLEFCVQSGSDVEGGVTRLMWFGLAVNMKDEEGASK